MTGGIMAFLHHMAAFALTAAIVYEHTMFHKNLTLAEARRIQHPTIRFVSWNKSFAKNQAPEISDRDAFRIKTLLPLELLAIVLILFSAAMMARGVGMLQ